MLFQNWAFSNHVWKKSGVISKEIFAIACAIDIDW